MASQKSFDSATEELVGLTRERMRESKIPYSQALTEIARENPALCERYHEEALSGRPLVVRRSEAFCEHKPSETQVRLLALTDQIKRERGLGYREALTEACRQAPELAEAYRREIPGLR